MVLQRPGLGGPCGPPRKERRPFRRKHATPFSAELVFSCPHMKSNKITTPRHYGFIASRTPDKGFLPCTISLTLGRQTGRCPVWARSGRGRTGARLLNSAPCAPEFCVGYWAGNSPGLLVSPELGPRVDTGQWGWAARGQATQLPTPTSPGPAVPPAAGRGSAISAGGGKWAGPSVSLGTILVPYCP